MSILEVSGLRKVYTSRFGGNQVEALKNVNFSVEDGEYVAIMGESGTCAKGYALTQSYSEITHREAEGESANTPQHTEDDGHEDVERVVGREQFSE